jgi:hypothetical protein
MQITRRSFISSFVAALAMPRLALPQPAPGMKDEVADGLVVFHECVDTSVVYVRFRTVLFGALAKDAIARDPHLWSAVMVNRKLG